MSTQAAGAKGPAGAGPARPGGRHRALARGGAAAPTGQGRGPGPASGGGPGPRRGAGPRHSYRSPGSATGSRRAVSSRPFPMGVTGEMAAVLDLAALARDPRIAVKDKVGGMP